MAKNSAKKFIPIVTDKNKYNMKVVTSSTCEACKQQCAKGLLYLDKMSKPGAVGYGVPCILTKGKGFK